MRNIFLSLLIIIGSSSQLSPDLFAQGYGGNGNPGNGPYGPPPGMGYGGYGPPPPGMYPGIPNAVSPTALISRNRDVDVTTKIAPQITLSNKINRARVLICDKDDFDPNSTVDLSVPDLKKNWDSEWEELVDSLVINAIESKVKLISDYVYLKVMPYLSNAKSIYPQPPSNYIRIKVKGLQNEFQRRTGNPTVRIIRNRSSQISVVSAPKFTLSNGAQRVRLYVCDKDDFTPESTLELDIPNLSENWDEDWQLLLADLISTLITNKVDLRFDLLHIKFTSSIGGSEDEEEAFKTPGLRIKVNGLIGLFDQTISELMGGEEAL